VDSLRSIASQVAPYIYIALLIAVVVLIKHYLEPNGEEEAHLYVAGPIMVLDGDTLKAGEREYRIFGIDAPEFSQACSEPSGQLWNCGRAARARLGALVAGGALQCLPRARDRFGRIVATCSVSNAPDLGEVLVREGLAINFGGFAEGPYIDAETEARLAKRGIWRGAFDRPADWRRAHPRTAD
jgi:endonuclease YncB( thermonuclease family)